VLASTRTPDLSHLTIFAYGQKQICQALKGSAPRTATINKEAEGDCVCMCTHVHAHTCMHVPAVLFQQPGCTLFWNSLTKSTDDLIQQARATKYCWHLEIQDPGKTQEHFHFRKCHKKYE